jgi:hypothetical protein
MEISAVFAFATTSLWDEPPCERTKSALLVVGSFDIDVAVGLAAFAAALVHDLTRLLVLIFWMEIFERFRPAALAFSMASTARVRRREATNESALVCFFEVLLAAMFKAEFNTDGAAAATMT